MDTETGMYDYGFRDYAPQQMRFSTVDPIRDGLNWYSYVGNDPVNYVDLWGLWDIAIGVEGEVATPFGGIDIGAGVGIFFRDIEGIGYTIDANFDTFSLQLFFDGDGFNGAGASWGPGKGASGSLTNTKTATFTRIWNGVKNFFGNGNRNNRPNKEQN